jgi:predicted membrane protein
MGGCEIDLRDASIAADSTAVIDCFAFWGGIDVRVPEDWTVMLEVTPLMGGIEDKTRPAQQGTSGKRLHVRGFAIMGGIVIKN